MQHLKVKTLISFPVIPDKNGITIYPLAHLAVLTVSGKDAAKFLQGQITCNINDSAEQNRFPVISEADKTIALWPDRVGNQGFQPENSDQRRFLDIISGIPWLTTNTSEEFIPQMLNLDQLGGISFKKGCYTGQEIVARTHYLGKAKRALFLAECDKFSTPEANSAIMDNGTGTEQIIGKVLPAQRSLATHGNDRTLCKMLIVLQVSGSDISNLKLQDHNPGKIILLTEAL